MAQPTGTFDSYDGVGNRESLSDIISNIAPTETPFRSSIKKGKAKATFEEWQQDDLATANADNAAVDGGDAGAASHTPTVRVGNRTQIFTKVIQVSGTQEAVDKAGRKSELNYQTMKKGKEINRDIEAALLSNNASVEGDSSTARKLGGLESWIETNVSGGTGYSDGGFGSGNVAAPTDGTQRALAESQLKEVMQSCFTNGGNPDRMFLGPVNKGKFSAFAGIADTRHNVNSNKMATIIGAADVYVSDFGNIAVIPSRFHRERTGLVIDTSMAEVRTLRAMKRNKLAKTGDSEKRQLLTELTLCVKNEKAFGKIADLTTS
jgi:hypothetical protein